MNALKLLVSATILVTSSWPLFAADRVSDASSGKAPVAGDVVLFPFDDYGIPWRENLKVTLQQPARYAGNPVTLSGKWSSMKKAYILCTGGGDDVEMILKRKLDGPVKVIESGHWPMISKPEELVEDMLLLTGTAPR